MRVIAIEEHFFPTEILALMASPTPPQGGPDYARMTDVGAARLADMDASGIDMQVLSTPTDMVAMEDDVGRALELARIANDIAAAAGEAHPDRFSAFALLPTWHPAVAADELERTVTTHGFKGALLAGHIRGRFLDDQFFWPIFERAQALDVPIYLHPGKPPEAVMQAYYSGFEPPVNLALGWAAWGWHCEAGLHALRLILGGVLDRFPNLQIIIGHLGENLPFSIDRADWFLSGTAKNLQRSVAEYYQQNFYLTTSGCFSIAPLQCALATIGVDRMMFAVDYPFANNAEGHAFLEQAPISPGDRAKIAHLNAERLLRIEPAAGT